MLRIGLIASLFALFGQGQVSIILKAWEINAVLKRKDSNCIGILFDQGEGATASNLSEYTITVCIFASGYDIKNLMANSYSVP